MASREIIETAMAPEAIGPYSQAVKVENTVYLSGQIPLDRETMELVQGDIRQQVCQVFDNLTAVAEAAGGSLAEVVKLTIYLTELSNFSLVNQVMEEYFQPPYPARAAVGVAQLPRQAQVEMDAVLILDS